MTKWRHYPRRREWRRRVVDPRRDIVRHGALTIVQEWLVTHSLRQLVSSQVANTLGSNNIIVAVIIHTVQHTVAQGTVDIV